MSEAVLRAQGLGMAYGRRKVVADVSFEVAPGSVYALLGRNGAGKSTLVRALLGFERAGSGSASLFGLDAWKDRARTMARVGVVAETPDVPPAMDARAAARFCGRFCPRWDQAAVEARLARFGIEPLLPFGKLSRGQQTQVCLALALGGGPDLLVLDDPTLGLDPVARRDLYRELLEVLAERGTTVFITTHDLAGIEGLADRVGILHEGRMLLDEPLESLKARHRRIHGGPGYSEAGLAGLGPLSVTRGAFGLEATVSRYSEASLAAAGLEPNAVEGSSLEEIFLATVAGGAQS